MRSSTPNALAANLQVRGLIRAIPMLRQNACMSCKSAQIASVIGAGQSHFSRRNLAWEPGREPGGFAGTSAASGRGGRRALIPVRLATRDREENSAPCATARRDGIRTAVDTFQRRLRSVLAYLPRWGGEERGLTWASNWVARCAKGRTVHYSQSRAGRLVPRWPVRQCRPSTPYLGA
jgi:hypothetical protein